MISIDASRACEFCMTCVKLTLAWVVALQAYIVPWSWPSLWLTPPTEAPAALAKQALYFLDLIDSRRLQQISAAFVGDNYIVIERDYIEEWMRVTEHADGRVEVSMGQVWV